MENKELLDLFGTVLIGIVCPLALLIDNNPIVLTKKCRRGRSWKIGIM